MLKQKMHIGTQVSKQKHIIERGFLRRFNDAVQSFDVTHSGVFEMELDEKHPLPHAAFGAFGDFQKIYKILDIKPGQILISRCMISVIEPVFMYDEIEVCTLINDLFEQKASAGSLGILITNIVGKKNNKIAFHQERIFCIRGGFHRR